MKRMRTSIMLIVILVLTSVLSACTKEELALLSAVRRLSAAKSYAQTSHISFSMDFASSDAATKETLQQLQSMFRGLAYNTRVKFAGDKANNRFKASVAADFLMDPITVSSDMWMDVDMSGGNSKYQIVVRVPEMFKLFLPEAYRKDYLTIDYTAYMELLAGEYSAVVSADMTQYGAAEENLLKLLQLVRQSDKTNSNFVLMSTTANGMTKLTLKITDAQLKALILSVAEDIKTNSELQELLVDVAAAISLPMDEMDRVVIKKAIADGITDLIPAMKEYFAAHKLLGDNGLRYEVILNADDYIVDETLAINIHLDETMLADMYYVYADDFEGYVDFTVTVKNEYTNINEEIELNYPVLTDANSVDLVEAMKAQAEAERESNQYAYFPYPWYFTYYGNTALKDLGCDNYVDLPLKGTFAGKPVNATIQIVYYEDELCYFMPLRQAAQIFGGTVAWNSELGMATWTVNGETMYVITPVSDERLGEEDNGVFDWDFDWIEYGRIHNGTTYVDMENAGWFVDAEFGYEMDTDTILLR